MKKKTVLFVLFSILTLLMSAQPNCLGDVSSFSANPITIRDYYKDVIITPNVPTYDTYCLKGFLPINTEKISWKYKITRVKKIQKGKSKRYRYSVYRAKYTANVNLFNEGVWEEVFSSNLKKPPLSHKTDSWEATTYALPVSQGYVYKIILKVQSRHLSLYQPSIKYHSHPVHILLNPNITSQQLVDFDLQVTPLNGNYYNAIVKAQELTAGQYIYWEVCEAKNSGSWDCKTNTLVSNPQRWWKNAHFFHGYNGTLNLLPEFPPVPGKFQKNKIYLIKYGIFGDNQPWVGKIKKFNHTGVLAEQ